MSGLSFRAEVEVIDANVGVGHSRDRVAPFVDADGLLAEMDRHGVGRAVVYHVQGEAVSALDGNDLLHEWVDGQDRLIPQWVASAHPDSLAQLRQLHADGKVRSVRLHDTVPSLVPLTEWVYGDLLTWLAAERLPLWVSLADNDVVQLVDTLGQHPELECVLLGAHYTHAAIVRPLLRALPRARLELSREEVLGDVESLAAELGAHRLIYGSYYPRYAMGSILYYLHRCDLSGAQLRAICAGNTRALLGLGKGAS